MKRPDKPITITEEEKQVIEKFTQMFKDYCENCNCYSCPFDDAFCSNLSGGFGGSLEKILPLCKVE